MVETKQGPLIDPLLRVIDGISEWTGKIFAPFLLITMLIVVYEVLSRRLIDIPQAWTYESITLFYGANFMFMAAYTLLYKKHVSVDIFYNRLSLKGQAIIEIISYLIFFFPFFILVIYVGADYAAVSWSQNEITMSARLPYIMPILKTVTPVSMFLLLLQGIAEFIRCIYVIVKGVPA